VGLAVVPAFRIPTVDGMQVAAPVTFNVRLAYIEIELFNALTVTVYKPALAYAFVNS
jgi:hypothetical protein